MGIVVSGPDDGRPSSSRGGGRLERHRSPRRGVAAALLVMILSLTACRGSGSPPHPAQRIVGWLRTEGSRIVDARGNVVRFLGVGMTDLASGNGGPASEMPVRCLGWEEPPTQAIDNIATWGFNAVRLSVTWANIEPSPPLPGPNGMLVHQYNQAYLHAVDDTIHAFTARGIAVILDLSQNVWSPAFARSPTGPCRGWGMPTWLYAGTPLVSVALAKQAFFSDQGGVQEEFAAVWRLIGARYRANRLVVGADMMNEPYFPPSFLQPSELQLDRLYEKLGRAIRQVDPRILLVFQDSQYTGTGQFAVTHPPPFRNVAYSMHLYGPDWQPDGIRRQQAYEQRARRWHVPLFVGEFNAFGYGSNGEPVPPRWMPDALAFEAYCRARGLGWIFQGYDGGTSLTIPGTQQPKPGLLPVLQQGF